MDSFEVIVAGGGVVGATLALALARGGLAVALIDAAPLPQAPPAGAVAPFDGRASAIAAAPFRMFDALGLDLAPQAQGITRMVVSDGEAPGAGARGLDTPSLIFGAADADTDGPLGWMIENRRLRLGLTAVLESAGVTVFAPARVADVSADAQAASVTLGDGQVLTAPLAVGAEGRESAVRTAVGIDVTGWAYGRSGVVATVLLERPHQGVAYQHFLPGGPLAVLPLPPGGDDPRDRASLVWTEAPGIAASLAGSSDEAFAAVLRRRFGDILGAMTPTGPRFAHPLALQLADRLTAPRVALAGDAAQVIHPLAGQGLNLGLKDAAALAEVVIEARRLGEDFGSAAVLERYARWRRFDRMVFAAGTDAFHRIYGTSFPGARLIRGLGMAAIDAAAPVKRLLAKQAAGEAGDVPRLLTGELV